MDEEVTNKILASETVREAAQYNGIDDAALHAIVDSIVLEVRTNIRDYVDMVCGRWF